MKQRKTELYVHPLFTPGLRNDGVPISNNGIREYDMMLSPSIALQLASLDPSLRHFCVIVIPLCRRVIYLEPIHLLKHAVLVFHGLFI